MAIWQFYCNIIPAKENIDKLSYDDIISWEGISCPMISTNFLQREKSWSANIVQYGKTDETCIEFIYQEDKMEEISCRLDLRTLSKNDLIQIIKYVQDIKACFLVENKVYLPRLEIMIEVMKQSRANQYCKNPLNYFLSINQME